MNCLIGGRVNHTFRWLSRAICVACLYVMCGAISGFYLLTVEISGQLNDPRFYIVPLPFAILSLLILRPHFRLLALWPIPLSIFVWLSAYIIAVAAVFAGTLMPFRMYLPAMLGGLIGGAGAAAVFGIWRGGLHRPLCIWGAAFVGCLGGIPFSPVETWLHHNPGQMAIGFAVWQASVGVYLYLVSSQNHGD